MPLEIRELLVKVAIEENNAAGNFDEKRLQEIKHAIIKECTEEVLLKLENLSAR